MKKYVLIMIALLWFVGTHCSSDTPDAAEKGPIIMPINPNGDSELALLMRDLFEDGMKAKEQIKQGEIPKLVADFEKIHTAQATEPEKAASPAYKVHGLSYLQAVAALKNANQENLETSYTNMVDACMNCHRALCPGPMVRIKKMYL